MILYVIQSVKLHSYNNNKLVYDNPYNSEQLIYWAKSVMKNLQTAYSAEMFTLLFLATSADLRSQSAKQK